VVPANRPKQPPVVAANAENSLLRELVGDRKGPREEEMRDDRSELSELESSVVGTMEVE